MPGKVTVYNAANEPVDMWAIDARDAVMNHPNEWSYEPSEKPKAAKTSSDPALVPSSEIITERAGPTRRDGPETLEAQSDPHAVGKPQPVDDPAEELGEDEDEEEVEEAKPTETDPDKMSYSQLQAFVAEKTGENVVGVKKVDLLKKVKALSGGGAA